MDSDAEEMLTEIFDEEDQAAVDDEEHLMILNTLAGLLVNSRPRRVGSTRGRRKSKQRQRYEGYCILYSDYFANDPTQDEKVFWCRFRMNRKLFLWIMHAIREFDT